MNITIGSFLPKNNIKCQVSGKVLGPAAQQKAAYMVQAQNGDKKYQYIVASRQLADKLVKNISEKWGNDE